MSMTNPTYRALCAEILQKLDQYEDGQRVDWDAWRNNARAALAAEPVAPTAWMYQSEPDFDGKHWHENWKTTLDEKLARYMAGKKEPIPLWCSPTPQPEPVAPTVMQILALSDEIESEGLGTIDLVRRALARWGTPTAQPVPVSERLPTEQDVAELAENVEFMQLPQDESTRSSFLLEFTRQALARWGRPTPQPPADGEVAELVEWLRNPLIVGGTLSDSASRWLTRAADLLQRLASPACYVLNPSPEAQPEPVAPVWADIHYAWELLDAEGDWQAGGAANSLEDVQREGNRYLQTYSQDGPHKQIIQRHCVNTIEDVTND